MKMFKRLLRWLRPVRTLDDAMRELAEDLRDGTVPEEKFTMRSWCGTAMCIAGHLVSRGHEKLLEQEGVEVEHFVDDAGKPAWDVQTPRGSRLRALFVPQTTALFTHNRMAGAAAIDNYLAGVEHPWRDVEVKT